MRETLERQKFDASGGQPLRDITIALLDVPDPRAILRSALLHAIAYPLRQIGLLKKQRNARAVGILESLVPLSIRQTRHGRVGEVERSEHRRRVRRKFIRLAEA